MNWVMQSIKMFFISVKSGLQIGWGIYKLSRLKGPIITIFGGSQVYEDGKYARWAETAAIKCVEHNMSVITGGGPGVMEAAARGATEKGGPHGWTLGIRVNGVDPDFKQPYGPHIVVSYFFVRKWLLTRFTCGFILFPGGIGTADEFFEVLNLIKLAKITHSPVVLVGTNFWKDLIAWYHHAYDKQLIPMPPDQAFTLTDDPVHAVDIIVDFCRKNKK